MSDAKGGTPPQDDQSRQETETAEHWFAVMHSGAPTDQEVAAFTNWRDADPQHAQAYTDLEKIWTRVGEHGDHPEIKKMRKHAAQQSGGSSRRSNVIFGRRHLLSLAVVVVVLGLLLSTLL